MTRVNFKTSLFAVLAAILTSGSLLLHGQTTTIPGLGTFTTQAQEEAAATEASTEAAPRDKELATPNSSRGINLMPQREEAKPVDASMIRIGRPETMNLLDNTRQIMLGDRLEYMVAEDREAPIVLFVDEAGRVDVPLAGKIPAEGKTSRQLAFDISEKLEEEYYYQATVHVSEFRDARSRGQVFVMGQVSDQGMIPIPTNEVMTVSRAILTAGGFTPRADPTRVTVTRQDSDNPGEEKRIDINVADVLEKGELDKDMVLRPNDLVFVAMRGDASGTYTVSGSVRSPGMYPLGAGQELLVSQAILMAGGFTEFGKGSAVKVVRHDEAGNREEIVVNIDEVLEKGNRDADIKIQPEDQIIVPERWFSF